MGALGLTRSPVIVICTHIAYSEIIEARRVPPPPWNLKLGKPVRNLVPDYYRLTPTFYPRRETPVMLSAIPIPRHLAPTVGLEPTTTKVRALYRPSPRHHISTEIVIVVAPQFYLHYPSED